MCFPPLFFSNWKALDISDPFPQRNKNLYTARALWGRDSLTENKLTQTIWSRKETQQPVKSKMPLIFLSSASSLTREERFYPLNFPPGHLHTLRTKQEDGRGRNLLVFFLSPSLSFFPLPYIFHFPSIHLILFTLNIFFSIDSPRHRHWKSVEFVCVELSQWLESFDCVHEKDPLSNLWESIHNHLLNSFKNIY